MSKKLHWTSTWLKDNISSILALMFTAECFHIFNMTLLREIKAPENITFLIISSIVNIVMLVVGFYFGSSKSSHDKQASMDKMNENTTTLTESLTNVGISGNDEHVVDLRDLPIEDLRRMNTPEALAEIRRREGAMPSKNTDIENDHGS